MLFFWCSSDLSLGVLNACVVILILVGVCLPIMTIMLEYYCTCMRLFLIVSYTGSSPTQEERKTKAVTTYFCYGQILRGQQPGGEQLVNPS